MATVTDIGTLITQSPGICGGRLRIAGTGVSVLRIAGWYNQGHIPEMIATEYPILLSPRSMRPWLTTTPTATKWMRRSQPKRPEADRLERGHRELRKRT